MFGAVKSAMRIISHNPITCNPVSSLVIIGDRDNTATTPERHGAHVARAQMHSLDVEGTPVPSTNIRVDISLMIGSVYRGG